MNHLPFFPRKAVFQVSKKKYRTKNERVFYLELMIQNDAHGRNEFKKKIGEY